MIIFIRKIPANTRYSDIAAFVEPALHGGWFRKSGHISKLEILTLKDNRLHTIEFHALVSVEPDAAGFRAIKRLKGKRLKDKMVTVRQYFHRSWQNDPRQQHTVQPVGSVEKRRTDRRRGKDLERIQDVSDHFSSNGDFVRKG